MFVSFHKNIPFAVFPKHEAWMLTYYKQVVWGLYQELQGQGFDIKLRIDQEIHFTSSEYSVEQTQISLSEWQDEKSLEESVHSQKDAVIIIHSFNEIDDIRNLINNQPTGSIIYMVVLSKVFSSYFALHWTKRIFLKASSDELSQLKEKWPFHPLRFKLLQQEKEIIHLLNKSATNVVIIDKIQ
jgi:hypothetical protein